MKIFDIYAIREKLRKHVGKIYLESEIQIENEFLLDIYERHAPVVSAILLEVKRGIGWKMSVE